MSNARRLPILALLAFTRLRWKFRAAIRSALGWAEPITAPTHQRQLDGGFWFCHDPCDPFVTGYFSPPERTELANTLRHSNGQRTLLSSHLIHRGWLLKTWSGLVVLGPDQRACEQVSSGSGKRFAVSPRPRLLSNCFAALQRNDTNYAHFLCEVACSLLGLEEAANAMPRLAISASFGREILSRAGFKQPITIVPNNTLTRIYNVETFSMIPSGYMHAELLRELRRRILESLIREAGNTAQDSPTAEVLFLHRGNHDRRQLLNWRDVVGAAARRFPELHVVTPAECTFREQVSAMANARIIIAPQGAHAANLLWAPKLEHYIEITGNGDGYVAAMATTLGCNVHQVISRLTLDNPDSPSANDILYADHVVDLESVSSLLHQL
jgi:hypothetical protein